MTQDFKKLKVWRESFDFANEIYKITKSFPKDENYGLTSQLKRASLSISNNIAEGCGRRTSKDFASFLHNSMGSLKECETLVLFAKEQSFITIAEYNDLIEKLETIGKQLNNFIKKVRDD